MTNVAATTDANRMQETEDGSPPVQRKEDVVFINDIDANTYTILRRLREVTENLDELHELAVGCARAAKDDTIACDACGRDDEGFFEGQIDGRYAHIVGDLHRMTRAVEDMRRWVEAARARTGGGR